jgi:hypothetical protein
MFLSLSTHSNDDGIIDTSIYRYVDNMPRAVTHHNDDEEDIYSIDRICSHLFMSSLNIIKRNHMYGKND